MFAVDVKMKFLLQGRRRGSDQLALSSPKLQFVSETSGSEEGQVEPYCLSDAGLTVLAEGFSKLEKLSLIWCSNVSCVGLMSLAYNCVYLKSLDLQVFVKTFILVSITVLDIKSWILLNIFSFPTI